MKLYGAAFAITASKADENEAMRMNFLDKKAIDFALNRNYRLTCTIIAVEDNDRTKFEVIDKLSFVEDFSLANPAKLMELVQKTSGTLGQVTLAQMDSLNKAELDYVPFTIYAGKDSATSLNLDLLQELVFRDAKSVPANAEDALMKLLGPQDGFKSRYEYVASEIGGNAGKYTSEFDGETLFDPKLIRDSFPKLCESHGVDIFEVLHDYTVVEKAISARNDYLEQNPALQDKLSATYQRLSTVAEHAHLKWGSYSGPVVKEFSPESHSKNLERNPELGAKNFELNLLQDRLSRGDSEALTALVNIAEADGTQCGKDMVIKHGEASFSVFVAKPAPWKDFANRADLQQLRPDIAYLDWHPDIKDTWMNSYKQELALPYNVAMKTALDGRKPPFTDPCAAMIWDQFDVLEGRRGADEVAVKDEKVWREMIVDNSDRMSGVGRDRRHYQMDSASELGFPASSAEQAASLARVEAAIEARFAAARASKEQIAEAEKPLAEQTPAKPVVTNPKVGTQQTQVSVNNDAEVIKLVERKYALLEAKRNLPRKLFSEEIKDKAKWGEIETEIERTKSQIDRLLTQPLSRETLERVYADSTPEIRNIHVEQAISNAQQFDRLPDMSETIARTNNFGSRQQSDRGYFPAVDAQGQRVVLFRGDFGTAEQGRLLGFLDRLEQENPNARAILPAVRGHATVDGNTYLVMEDLSASGRKFGGTEVAENFLRQNGDTLTPEFRAVVERTGLNISNTSIEHDYVFTQPDGTVRVGIPYRAGEFAGEAEKMFRTAKNDPEIAARVAESRVVDTPSAALSSADDIAQRLIVVEEVKPGEVWKLRDPVTGKEYFGKTASDAEIDMTKKANAFEKPVGSPVEIAQSLDTTRIPDSLQGSIPTNDMRSKFLIVDAAPEGPTLVQLYKSPNSADGLNGALRGQPITPDEFKGLIETIKLMNENGISHHDLKSNTNVVRGEDGTLRIHIYDFEPHSFDPLYKGTTEDLSHVLSSSRNMIEAGVLSPDAQKIIDAYPVPELLDPVTPSSAPEASLENEVPRSNTGDVITVAASEIVAPDPTRTAADTPHNRQAQAYGSSKAQKILTTEMSRIIKKNGFIEMDGFGYGGNHIVIRDGKIEFEGPEMPNEGQIAKFKTDCIKFFEKFGVDANSITFNNDNPFVISANVPANAFANLFASIDSELEQHETKLRHCLQERLGDNLISYSNGEIEVGTPFSITDDNPYITRMVIKATEEFTADRLGVQEIQLLSRDGESLDPNKLLLSLSVQEIKEFVGIRRSDESWYKELYSQAGIEAPEEKPSQMQEASDYDLEKVKSEISRFQKVFTEMTDEVKADSVLFLEKFSLGATIDSRTELIEQFSKLGDSDRNLLAKLLPSSLKVQSYGLKGIFAGLSDEDQVRLGSELARIIGEGKYDTSILVENLISTGYRHAEFYESSLEQRIDVVRKVADAAQVYFSKEMRPVVERPDLYSTNSEGLRFIHQDSVGIEFDGDSFTWKQALKVDVVQIALPSLAIFSQAELKTTEAFSQRAKEYMSDESRINSLLYNHLLAHRSVNNGLEAVNKFLSNDKMRQLLIDDVLNGYQLESLEQTEVFLEAKRTIMGKLQDMVENPAKYMAEARQVEVPKEQSRDSVLESLKEKSEIPDKPLNRERPLYDKQNYEDSIANALKGHEGEALRTVISGRPIIISDSFLPSLGYRGQASLAGYLAINPYSSEERLEGEDRNTGEKKIVPPDSREQILRHELYHHVDMAIAADNTDLFSTQEIFQEIVQKELSAKSNDPFHKKVVDRVTQNYKESQYATEIIADLKVQEYLLVRSGHTPETARKILSRSFPETMKAMEVYNAALEHIDITGEILPAQLERLPDGSLKKFDVEEARTLKQAGINRPGIVKFVEGEANQNQNSERLVSTTTELAQPSQEVEASARNQAPDVRTNASQPIIISSSAQQATGARAPAPTQPATDNPDLRSSAQAAEVAPEAPTRTAPAISSAAPEVASDIGGSRSNAPAAPEINTSSLPSARMTAVGGGIGTGTSAGMSSFAIISRLAGPFHSDLKAGGTRANWAMTAMGADAAALSVDAVDISIRGASALRGIGNSGDDAARAVSGAARATGIAGKFLGKAPVVGMVLSVGAGYADYETALAAGDMERAYGAVGGTTGGVLGGFAAGGAIGLAGGPAAPITVPIGAIAGGFAGAYYGDEIARELARKEYGLEFNEEKQEAIDSQVKAAEEFVAKQGIEFENTTNDVMLRFANAARNYEEVVTKHGIQENDADRQKLAEAESQYRQAIEELRTLPSAYQGENGVSRAELVRQQEALRESIAREYGRIVPDENTVYEHTKRSLDNGGVVSPAIMGANLANSLITSSDRSAERDIAEQNRLDNVAELTAAYNRVTALIIISDENESMSRRQEFFAQTIGNTNERLEVLKEKRESGELVKIQQEATSIVDKGLERERSNSTTTQTQAFWPFPEAEQRSFDRDSLETRLDNDYAVRNHLAFNTQYQGNNRGQITVDISHNESLKEQFREYAALPKDASEYEITKAAAEKFAIERAVDNPETTLVLDRGADLGKAKEIAINYQQDIAIREAIKTEQLIDSYLTRGGTVEQQELQIPQQEPEQPNQPPKPEPLADKPEAEPSPLETAYQQAAKAGVTPEKSGVAVVDNSEAANKPEDLAEAAKPLHNQNMQVAESDKSEPDTIVARAAQQASTSQRI